MTQAKAIIEQNFMQVYLFGKSTILKFLFGSNYFQFSNRIHATPYGD